MPQFWHRMKLYPRTKDASKRERQLLEALYRLGRASALDIQAAIPNPPTYTAVRTHLSNLEQKGLVKVDTSGQRYVYEPAVAREEMAKSVAGEVLSNFFENRLELLVATLLDRRELPISPEQLDTLAELIEKAREAGR